MLAFLLLSRENRWSSKSHHACMFGRGFISKAKTKRNGSRDDFRFLFSSLGNRSKAPDLTPGAPMTMMLITFELVGIIWPITLKGHNVLPVVTPPITLQSCIV